MGALGGCAGRRGRGKAGGVYERGRARRPTVLALHCPRPRPRVIARMQKSRAAERWPLPSACTRHACVRWL